MAGHSSAHGFSRQDRVGEQIKRDLSALIRERVKDPRLGMVTVLDVEMSKDLAHAKVWFDTLQEEHGHEAQGILNQAAGFLRHELGRGLKLRVTPELRFYYDDTQSRGNALSALIDKAVAEDQANHDTDEKPTSE